MCSYVHCRNTILSDGSWALVVELIQIADLFLLDYRKGKEEKIDVNADKKQVGSPWVIQWDLQYLETWGPRWLLKVPEDQCVEEQKEREGGDFICQCSWGRSHKRKILDSSYHPVTGLRFSTLSVLTLSTLWLHRMAFAAGFQNVFTRLRKFILYQRKHKHCWHNYFPPLMLTSICLKAENI